MSAFRLEPLDSERLFPGEGELARLMREFDWSSSDLGPPQHWTENLRISLGLCLTSRIPIALCWGPNLTLLYNDACAALLRSDEPARVLGRSARECWGDLWDILGPLHEKVRATGKAAGCEDQLCALDRKLPREEIYCSFTLSPILDADGEFVEGTFCMCAETTERVIATRRLETVRKLAMPSAEAPTPEAVCQRAARVLAQNRMDIPFAALYLVDPADARARLEATAGALEAQGLPRSVAPAHSGPADPLATVLRTHRKAEIRDLKGPCGELAGAAASDSAIRALALPIQTPLSDHLGALLVMGINPRLVWDAAYQAFFERIASCIGGALIAAATRLAETSSGLERPDSHTDTAAAQCSAAADGSADPWRYLRESEERHRILIELSPQAVWTCRTDGYCTFFNQFFLDYTGLTQAQCRGHGWTSAVHSDHRERVLAAWTHAIQTGERYELEVPIRRAADASYRWFLLRSIPVRDPAGAIVRWSGIAVDIDDRKCTEEALRDADRRKNEFLAMLGHELRNPLSAVNNSIAVARIDPARRDRALVIARRQTQQLARLVDDLLDVARITQGRIALHTQRVDLAGIVERAVEVTRPLVEEREHTLTVALTRGDLQIEGDASRLQQVVVNLIANAAKYTEPGGHIQLHAQRQGDALALRVRDNGIGISADMTPHVFELFTQAQRSLERAQGGLGIGLTVVKRIVELHGGSVEVRSEGVGKGAEFVVTLPAAAAPAEPGPTPAAERAKRARPPMQILLVEDNRDAADSLVLFLEMLGHRVKVLYDGTAAVECAPSHAPDLMLVDIGIPGLSGYEVARRLRGDRGMRHVPLIALTGYGRDEDKAEAMAAGFDHHLVKPVDLEVLENLVHRLASKAGN